MWINDSSKLFKPVLHLLLLPYYRNTGLLTLFKKNSLESFHLFGFIEVIVTP